MPQSRLAAGYKSGISNGPKAEAVVVPAILRRASVETRFAPTGRDAAEGNKVLKPKKGTFQAVDSRGRRGRTWRTSNGETGCAENQ